MFIRSAKPMPQRSPSFLTQFPAGPSPMIRMRAFPLGIPKIRITVYFYDQVVVGADPQHSPFTILQRERQCDFYDAHDALHYYYRGGLRPPPAQWTITALNLRHWHHEMVKYSCR